MEAKNAFTLQFECVLALKIAPNSIYVKNHILFSIPVRETLPSPSYRQIGNLKLREGRPLA